jgi:hypothetical protein
VEFVQEEVEAEELEEVDDIDSFRKKGNFLVNWC